MEIRIGAGGNKSGPHSGYSGTGKSSSGDVKRHSGHSNPHPREDDDGMEAAYEAADRFGAATRDGNKEAMVSTYRTFSRLMQLMDGEE